MGCLSGWVRSSWIGGESGGEFGGGKIRDLELEWRLERFGSSGDKAGRERRGR